MSVGTTGGRQWQRHCGVYPRQQPRATTGGDKARRILSPPSAERFHLDRSAGPRRHNLRLPGQITTSARHAMLHLPEYGVGHLSPEFAVALANIRGIQLSG